MSVAEGDSHLRKRPQRHINLLRRICVLQWAVGLLHQLVARGFLR
jgi:hypothetical protein